MDETTTPTGAGHGREVVTRVRMRARSRSEPHRASTPLELLFDLCFVVAVAQAGTRLVHALVEGRPGHGISGYLLIFFAVWWAWMNFTWFASAYDTDDIPYRIATLVQMSGVLVLAAGVPRAFDDADYGVAVAGYLIMRLALTGQWLRAACGESGAGRRVALRYVAGLVLVEFGWVGLLLLPGSLRTGGFLVLVAAELAVPAVAEHGHGTSWHPEHIAERYGLFTLIVLGETISAATLAVQSAFDESAALDLLLPIAAGGLLIVFAAFWSYFAVPIHEYLTSNRQAFQWGYSHYAVLGSAAAIGAGIEVAVEQVTRHTELSARAAAACVTAPTAVFLFTVWAVHTRPFKRGPAEHLVLPAGAAAVLLCTLAGHLAVPLAGAVSAATVAVGVRLAARRAATAAI
ncbi:low temperature requirement protein A [Streptomyces sp. NBC_01198]|uniref:low temperature requirement protein A n=1 Tax=Streptomyces sp. NBC_01198 TaxID=2903769 RepID=UPI002E11144D|nr:low temperature requirement protein A [Streptomyces sp. NBC_01198]